MTSNEDSFEALFAAEYGRVAGIANRVLADPHEAEDVAQEVFIDFNRLHSASAPIRRRLAVSGRRPQSAQPSTWPAPARAT